MNRSIAQKLTTLFICCAVLVTMIVFALWHINQEQKYAQQQFNSITNIHRGVDLLRSQLWSLLQYNDEASLQRVNTAQRELDDMLAKTQVSESNLKNLKRMSKNLAQLIEFERNDSRIQLTLSKQSLHLNDAQALIHARYNIIMEDMTETLLYEQKQLIKSQAQKQKQSLLKISVVLVVFTLLICLITYRILKYFKSGMQVMTTGIDKLSRGDLVSRITLPHNEEEFKLIVSGFNQMKASLQKSTVTRKELEYEVEKQTKLLKEQKERLKFLSERDPLTKLLNRRAINIKLEQTLAVCRRIQSQCALIFFDVDKFKVINDTKGHPCGDEILIQVSKRLEKWLSDGEFCGRFGGDEFVALLKLDNEIHTLPERLEGLIERLKQPIHFSNELICINVSIGVAIFPAEEATAEALIQCADNAMYKAKQVSGSHFHGDLLPPTTHTNVHKL